MSKSRLGLSKQRRLCVEMKCASVINSRNCFETHLNLPNDFTGRRKRMWMIRSAGSEGSISSSETTSYGIGGGNGNDGGEGGGDWIQIAGFFFMFSAFLSRAWSEEESMVGI